MSRLPKSDPSVFKLMFVVKQFRPDDIRVKVVEDDTVLVVHGKHEEVADEHGFVTREFTRRHKLPSDVFPDRLKATMSRDGLLVIAIPRKVEETPNTDRSFLLEVVDSAFSAIAAMPLPKMAALLGPTPKPAIEPAPRENKQRMAE